MAKRVVYLIRRVDHLADRWREGEERHHKLPGAPPGLTDRRVSPAPLAVEPGGSSRGRFGAIDRLQTRHNALAVLPRHKGLANCGSGERCKFAPWSAERACRSPRESPRLREGRLLSPSTTAISTSLMPRVFNSFVTLSQNPGFRRGRPGALCLFDPQPEHVLLALVVESEGDKSALLATKSSPRILTRSASK